MKIVRYRILGQSSSQCHTITYATQLHTITNVTQLTMSHNYQCHTINNVTQLPMSHNYTQLPMSHNYQCHTITNVTQLPKSHNYHTALGCRSIRVFTEELRNSGQEFLANIITVRLFDKLSGDITPCLSYR